MQHVAKNAWALGLLAVGLAVAFAAPPTVASDEGLVAAYQVSQTSYQSFLNSLYTHVGDDRRVRLAGGESVDHAAARQAIYGWFAGWGYDVEYEEFWHGTVHGWNIVATKLGTVDPTRQYIVGAHYDTWGGSIFVPAPGANDDGSGVALVLETARILSQYEFDRTIRFIAFDYEEHDEGWPVGSTAYVESHLDDNIEAMISADMVAYEPSAEFPARIQGHKASTEVVNALVAAAAEYGYGLTPTALGPDEGSDHAPFEDHGFNACLLTQFTLPENDPFWHTEDDTYEQAGNINWKLAVKMTRSVVGYLVDAAGGHVPVDLLRFTYPHGRPAYSDPRGGTRMRVVVTGAGSVVPQPGSGWCNFRYGNITLSAPMDQLEPNVYEAVFPRVNCGTHLKYWVNAASVEGDVYLDPPAGPGEAYLATATFGRVPIATGWPYPDHVESAWEWGQPNGHCGDPNVNYDIWGYNLDGCYENDLSERRLEFWSIDCAGQQDVHLSFRRWLNVERPGFDHAAVSVSDNHVNWTTAWENKVAVADTAWVDMDLDISAVADEKPGVFLRWTMGPTDADYALGGWNIDELVITGRRCDPPYPTGDMNCDGEITFDDIDPFVLALSDPSRYAWLFPACYIMNGDIDVDHVVDFDDVDPFVELLSASGAAP